MPESRLVAAAGRRSLVASWGSLALHGAAVALAVLLVRSRTRPARRTALTEIEVVDAVRLPGPPVPPPVAPPPVAAPRAAVHVGPDRELPRRAPTRPASVKEVAEVRVSFDHRNRFAGPVASEPPRDGDHTLRTAAAVAGGDRAAQDGLAALPMPGIAASASLARPPRAKHDYHNLPMHADRRFDGQTICVLISIDNRGKVRRVDLLRGVEPDLDASTIALVHAFEFEPALDDVGAPIPGYAKWDIVISDETQEASRDSRGSGFY